MCLRKSMLVYIALISGISLSTAYGQGQVSLQKKPNVLLICVDDLRPELGCYGKSFAKTPNIDRLASRGVLFKRHYVSVPTCGASRASLLTGRLPRLPEDLSNDVLEIRLSRQPTQTGHGPESFIEQFRRNGYKTVGMGKVSHSPDGYIYKYQEPVSKKRELPNSWDELLFNPGIWNTGWNAFFGYADGSNRNASNGAVKPYEAAEVTDEEYPDGLTAALAVQKLKELSAQEKPFLLGIGFFKPHLPFNAPKKYWDLYQSEDIPPAPYPDIPVGMNPASLQASSEFNSYKLGEEKGSLEQSVSEAYARKLRHAYMASVSYVDAQIGKVLDALKKEGLDKNTIVILWGDHGWHLGDDRVWGKHTLTEWSLRSPLIIALPGQKRSIVREEIVRSIDIYPSLMEACGITKPDGLDGISLLSLLKSSRHKYWDQYAWGYFNQGVTMRTSRYRITRYVRKGMTEVEVYDHSKDPYETTNIAATEPDLTARLLKEMEKGHPYPTSGK
jgi:iduronate 2-sulfatase